MSVYLGSNGMIMLRRSSGDQQITIKLTDDSIGTSDVTNRKILVWALPSVGRKDTANELGDKASSWQEYLNLTSLSTGDKVTLSGTAALGFIDKNTTGGASAETANSRSFYVYVDDMGSIRLYLTFKDSLTGAKATAVRLIAIPDGTTHTITVSIDNQGYRVLGQVVQYELNTSREAIDTTSLADQFRTQYSTLMTGSGRIVCNWDYLDLGVSKRWVKDTQQTNTASDENYQEVPHYLNQLLLRAEIGSEFLSHFFIKTSNGEGGTGDDQIWYNVRGVLTNVAMQFNVGNIIQMTADFITTGPFFLQSATEIEYKLLLESDYDLLLDQNEDKVIASTDDT